MAYSLETSSVKTIVPGAEVSGFADVVARARTNELGSSATMLSGAIDYVSAHGGSVSSYPYIVSANRGENSSAFISNPVLIFSGAATWPGLSQYAVKVNLSSDGGNTQCGFLAPAGTSQQGNSDIFLGWSTLWKAPSWQKLDVYQKTDTSSKQEISAALQYVSSNIPDLTNYYIKTDTSSKEELADAFENAGHSYSGIDPIQVDNINSTIGITGESLSAGPGIDMFSSGGYVVISANGGAGFPMTGNDGTRNYQMDVNSSAMYITTATGAAGATTKLTTPGVQYEAYPATDVSASWANIIKAANTTSNCYCITLNNANTAVDLENFSAYDRLTILHAQEYVADEYVVRWNNRTKTVPSGLFIEMGKVKYNGNTVWTFLNSGWYDDEEWD